jgi:methionyl-tRNA formyltransferase
MGLRIAFFGQAAFGRDVLVELAKAGHAIAGVYVPPDGGRPDPLAVEAEERSLPLFRHERFRRRGAAIPEIVSEYRGLRADLNVLAFVTAILPPEIVEAPPHQSLCFHPSLLPRFRGGAALAWQIIEGERETGVSVFRPDAGVDTGPILIQRGGVRIEDHHTAGTLYFQHLYALGVEAMVEGVAAVDAGTADFEVQDESKATFQGLVGDTEARIDWSRDAAGLDRLIRGCDPQPGAFAMLAGERVRLYGARLTSTQGNQEPGTITGVEDGRLRIAARGAEITVAKVKIGSGPKRAAAEAGLEIGQKLED